MGENPAQFSIDQEAKVLMSPGLHDSLSSYKTPLQDEELLSPWQPPEPTPFDPFQPVAWGPSQLLLSVAAHSTFGKSISTGVFERLTLDTNRRTTVKQKLADLRAKDEETLPAKPTKASKVKTGEVYRRLIRDSQIRQEVAKRSSAEPAEKAPKETVQKLTPPKEVQLLTRLAEDARRRSELQAKKQQELEEKEMEEAVRMANMHHPVRPRDPAVQQRLESHRLSPGPEAPPVPKKVLSSEECKQLGLRLMQAGRSSTPEVKAETEKITPKQAEAIINRLYAGKRTTESTPRPVAFRLQATPQPRVPSVTQQRKASTETLERLLADAELTIRSQSPRESLSRPEDLEDLIVRLKVKTAPQSLDSAAHRPQIQLRSSQDIMEPQGPSILQQPSMAFQLRPKSDLSDQELEVPKFGLSDTSRSVNKPSARVRRQGDILTKPPKFSPRRALEEAKSKPVVLQPGFYSLDMKKQARSSHLSALESARASRFVTSFDGAE